MLKKTEETNNATARSGASEVGGYPEPQGPARTGPCRIGGVLNQEVSRSGADPPGTIHDLERPDRAASPRYLRRCGTRDLCSGRPLRPGTRALCLKANWWRG